MSNVSFNYFENKAINHIKNALRRDGRFCKTKVNKTPYEKIELKLINESKKDNVFSCIYIDAGGKSGLKNTSFATISNDNKSNDYLNKLIENAVKFIHKTTPEAVPWL